MKKNTLIVLFIVIAILAVGAFLYFSQNPASFADTAEGEPAVTIVRTADGYEPNEVTIKKGDIILWTNEGDEFHWPASDLHPTHGIYPEFDPLKPLAPGEEWKFRFDEAGIWKFHDHIRANEVGTITVTE